MNAADALWSALDELELEVRRWDYPAAVRANWQRGDTDTARNVQASAEANARAVRANMAEGIELCRGFLAADDERQAMMLADRLVDRWRDWTTQVSAQNAAAVHAQRPWWDRWTDELDEWTRRAADAARNGANQLDQAARIGLAVAAAAALYLVSRR